MIHHLALLCCLSAEPTVAAPPSEVIFVQATTEKKKKKRKKWKKKRTVPSWPAPPPEAPIGYLEPVQESAPLPLDRLAFPVRVLTQSDRDVFCRQVAVEALNQAAVWQPIMAREEEKPLWRTLAIFLLGISIGIAFVIPFTRRMKNGQGRL